jgi:hypothetical protein
MVRILVADNQFFKQCMKFDWYPFASDCKGKPTDIFPQEVVDEIMGLYIPFIKLAIKLCDKTDILSKTVQKFAICKFGKETMKTLFKNVKLFSNSEHELINAVMQNRF